VVISIQNNQHPKEVICIKKIFVSIVILLMASGIYCQYLNYYDPEVAKVRQKKEAIAARLTAKQEAFYHSPAYKEIGDIKSDYYKLNHPSWLTIAGVVLIGIGFVTLAVITVPRRL
jgi:hypothetical protein